MPTASYIYCLPLIIWATISTSMGLTTLLSEYTVPLEHVRHFDTMPNGFKCNPFNMFCTPISLKLYHLVNKM